MYGYAHGDAAGSQMVLRLMEYKENLSPGDCRQVLKAELKVLQVADIF